MGKACDEVVIDRNNTSNIWLSTNGSLYKSINRGSSFTTTGYPRQPGILSSGQNGNVKSLAPYVAVDPNNSSVVYASTPSQGLEFTSDGGATFSQVTAVAAGIPPGSAAGTSSTSNAVNSGSCAVNSTSCTFTTNTSLGYGTGNYVQIWETGNLANQIFGTVTSDRGTSLVLAVVSTEGSGAHADWSVSRPLGSFNNYSSGGHIIAFDSHGGTTTVSGQTRTKNIYVCTFGLGVFASTDGGQTWTLTRSGPTVCQQMVVDPNGVLWFVANANNGIWTYNGNTWTQNRTIAPYAGNALAVAVNSNNCSSEAKCHVAVAGNGILYYTANGGSSWNTANSPTYTATDVPWMAAWYTNFGFLGVGGIKFDSTGKLFWSDEGIWYTTPSTSGSTLVLTSQGAGIEGLEGDTIISTSNSNGGAFLGGWDVGCFQSANPNVYPTAQSCYEQAAPGLHHAYSLTWTGNFLAVLADNQPGFGTYHNYSGTSSNNGVNWSLLNPPSDVPNNKREGGCIAASSSTNILWAPSDGGGGNVAPFYTTDGGTNWTQINVSVVTGGWPYRYYDINKICAADTVMPGVFYIYNYPNGHADALVKCTSGGASCFKVSTPGFRPDAAVNSTLKTVPGQAGYLFLSWGTVYPPQNTGGALYYSSNGGTTLTHVPNFVGVTTFGFGAAFPGHTFPTIWVAGWYNGAYGIWRCRDWDTSRTWQKVGDGYPNGWAMPILELDGDKNIPQQVYGITESGAFYGYISYLLNHDLDAALNDDSPMGLNQAV